MTSARPPIQLGLFAIPLGLAGLGGAWAAARQFGLVPGWPEEVLFGASVALWLVFSVGYLAGALRDWGRFGDDLRHPTSGPFVAFMPVVGILLNAHYGSLYPAAAPFVCVVLVAWLALLDALLIGHWLTSDLEHQALNMGYFLPVVAGSFIASIGLSAVNLHGPSVAAFGVGVFFFAVLGAIILGRLFSGGPLPLPVRPSVAILLAAPSTGGIALFVDSAGAVTDLQLGFAGIASIMLLVQLVLLPYYRQVPFALNFWTFTFPVASATNYAVRWLGSGDFAGRVVATWVLLAIGTVFVLVIAAASVVYVIRSRRNSTMRERAA